MLVVLDVGSIYLKAVLDGGSTRWWQDLMVAALDGQLVPSRTLTAGGRGGGSQEPKLAVVATL